jgi:hypothetical protein
MLSLHQRKTSERAEHHGSNEDKGGGRRDALESESEVHLRPPSLDEGQANKNNVARK